MINGLHTVGTNWNVNLTAYSYLGAREVESETEEELFEDTIEDTEEDEKEEDANDDLKIICRITSYHMFYKSVAVRCFFLLKSF